jgi:hypothetical protein
MQPIVILLSKQLTLTSTTDKLNLDYLVTTILLSEGYGERILHDFMTESQTTAESVKKKWLLREFQKLPNEVYLHLLQVAAGLCQIPRMLTKYFPGLLHLSTSLILANRTG